MSEYVQQGIVKFMNRVYSKEAYFGKKIFSCNTFDEYVLGLNPKRSWLINKSLELYKSNNEDGTGSILAVIDNQCIIEYPINLNNRIIRPTDDYGMSESIFQEIVRCSTVGNNVHYSNGVFCGALI